MVTLPPPEGKPRGRAASLIRPGRFIRAWLERVGEASISEMHQKLTSEIGKINALRPKAQRLRAPTYESFHKYFDRLRRLGLVEWVRDKPMEAEWGGQLLSIRVGPRPDSEARPSAVIEGGTRRVYRLSAAGKAPELAVLWDDPLARGLMREAVVALLRGPPPSR